jgi:hypothetical protein
MPSGWRQFVPLVLLTAFWTVIGCNTPIRKGKSPLMPAHMSSDSVVLEMFFVRFPLGDTTVNQNLWEEIDEQRFSPEIRERLTRNGFRMGLVTGQIPAELSKLLELTEKPAPGGELETAQVDAVDVQPRVVRRHLQIRANQPGEIIASGVYAQLPLLMGESGQLSGQTYHQAQGILAVKSLPQPNGQVRLELTPELHYDQPKQRWVGDQGMLRLESGRPKRTFDDMILSADLAPGDMLVMSSLPNRRGSLGDYFFTENESGRSEQKLLIVRLSQTQHNGLFDPPETLKLDP